MKMSTSKKNLLCSILVLVLIFIEGFFRGELINNFLIYLLIDSLTILLFSYVFSKCLIDFKNEKKKIPMIINLFSLLLSFLPVDDLQVYVTFPFNYQKRMEAVEYVRTEQFLDNDINLLQLPNQYKHLSIEGIVSIHNHDMICFYTLRGLSISGSKMLIYTTNSPDEIYKSFWKVFYLKKISDNWYYVKTR